MHIMYLVDQWKLGGVRVVISNLANAMAKKGHKVSIVTLYPADGGEVRSDVPEAAFFSCNASFSGDPGAVWKLAGHIRRSNPDIIHDHFGGLWAVPLHLIPGVSKRSIFHFHNEFSVIDSSPDTRRPMRDKVFYGYTIKKYARVLCVSRYNTKQLIDGAGLNPKTTLNLPNSIDPAGFLKKKLHGEDVRKTLGIPAGVPLIGIVGRFVYEKGFDTVVEVLAHLKRNSLPGAAAVFVGSGDEVFEHEVEELAGKLGVSESCYFVGRQSGVADYLKAMDVFMFLSRQEPFGLTALESMAVGTPIVATRPENGGGPGEFLRDGENARFLETRDVATIGEAVVEIIQQSGRKETLVINAKNTLTDYSTDAISQRLEQIYQAVDQEAT